MAEFLEIPSAAGAKVTAIMTPWHEDDLAARILKSEANVELVRLPVEAEEHASDGQEARRGAVPGAGEGCEVACGIQAVVSLRRAGWGARAWMALYQCSPRVEGGNLVRRDWWRF
ncbi:MAG: hypothetical protein ACLR8L_00120 [Oscillospiraceae bacterium]